MRRALLQVMPALTRFTFGALNPLTVERFTLSELSEYQSALRQHLANGGTL